jgi:AcrR family transcriptional regulator
MEAKVRQILSQSFIIFTEYGIKSISMDDLSSSMKISKKTLYKYFKNKEDIIEQLFLHYLSEEFTSFWNISSEKNHNAIDLLFDVKTYLISQNNVFTPAISNDLKTVYPHIYKSLQDKIILHAQYIIEKNIALGQAQQLYRTDVSTKNLVYIFSWISLLLQSNHENTVHIEVLVDEIIRLFVHGIANNEGIQRYQSILQSI